MAKKEVIKITEGQLKEFVKTAITKVLNENGGSKWEEESYWFACLPPKETGLPVTIMIDQGAFARKVQHPLWIYFRNSYDETDNTFLPITVEKSPKLIRYQEDKLNIYQRDFQKLLWFVATFYKQLKAISMDKMSVDTFLSHAHSLNESKSLLTEMGRFTQKETGLPFDVWVGVNPKGHFLGVKFPAKQGIKLSNDYAEYAVPEGKIESNIPVDKQRLNLIHKFVEANKEALIELGKNFELYHCVKDNLVKVDAHGNPIQNSIEPAFYPCTKSPINGFIRVRNKECKYNYLCPDGNTLLSNIWFDDAQDFVAYKSGITAAYVIEDGVPKWLYNDGTIKDIQ